MSGKPKPIIIVQGAQWGSEAKGAVAAFLCLQKKVKYAVRTGAVNAGHTVMWDGKAVKMQQLPTGWVNPRTTLVIGAGAFIHPPTLQREIEIVSSLTGNDVRNRLVIDHRASLHLDEHTDAAKLQGRHHLIGATGKGCSVAITDKIRLRGRGYRLFKQWCKDTGYTVNFTDTVDLLHSGYDGGARILLEGTQGSHLDLHLGPYPYTTHKQTQAAEWVVEAGLAPGMEYETVLVARIYPIRVAGNSGPMTDETTWGNIARTVNRKLMNKGLGQRVKSFALDEWEETLRAVANSGRYTLPKHLDGGPNYDFHKWTAEERQEYRVAISEMPAYALQQVSLVALAELQRLFEFTTVTNKLRRVAEWNSDDVRWSARVNRASYIVLTFFNYWFPELWGMNKFEWRDEYLAHTGKIGREVGCPVRYVTTGPVTDCMVETGV